MARPKKDPADVLEKIVSVGLSRADYAACLAKAKESGLGISALFREAVLTNRTERRKASPDKGRLLHLASKASNNVNQLTHRAHTDYLAGRVSESTYSALLFEMQQLMDFMKSAVKDAD